MTYIVKDLLTEILDYAIEDTYKIEPWICKLIDENKFERSIHFLKYKNSDYSEYLRICFIKDYKTVDTKHSDASYIFDNSLIKSNKFLIDDILMRIFWNENCIDIIEHILNNSDYKEFINEKRYIDLCQNTEALHLVEKYIIKGNLDNLTDDMLYYLTANEKAGSLLEKYLTSRPYLITKYYDNLTANSSMIHLLDQYLSLIDFKTYYDRRLTAIDRNILHDMCVPQGYKFNIDYNVDIDRCIDRLCVNENIMCIIHKYLPYVKQNGWYHLCYHNTTMDLIKNNLDKLDYDCWWVLWYNKNATSIILENKDKLDKRLKTKICSNEKYVDIILDNLDIHNFDHLCNVLESEYMWKFIDNSFEIFDSVPNKWNYLCKNKKIGYFIDKYKPDLEQFDESTLTDLCYNINGLKYLEKVSKKLDEFIIQLSCNPSVYKNIRTDIIKNIIRLL